MHDKCAEVVIYRSFVFFFQSFLVLIIIVHETFCGSKIVACQDKRDEWMILSHIGSRSYLDVTFLCILKWEEVIVVNKYSDTVSNSIKLCVRCFDEASCYICVQHWKLNVYFSSFPMSPVLNSVLLRSVLLKKESQDLFVWLPVKSLS